MIEIVKEGDKLSKSGLKGIEVNVNIAQLIRERVEQVRARVRARCGVAAVLHRCAA